MSASLGPQDDLGVGSTMEIDATMQAFSHWLTEMKARSNSSLAQLLSEMGIIRDGIASNSSDLTEYKRQSVSVQRQLQSQLSDLREKLASAMEEITSLVKQKTATDQELLSEISALQQQLSMKTAELEALKKSYSQTHQQLQNSLIQIQGQLQSTHGEILTAKQQAQSVQESAQGRLQEVERTLGRLRDILELSGKEGNGQASAIQDDISKLHEAVSALSTDFVEHKRLTLQVQNKLQSQVTLLEEGSKTLSEKEESSSLPARPRSPPPPSRGACSRGSGVDEGSAAAAAAAASAAAASAAAAAATAAFGALPAPAGGILRERRLIQPGQAPQQLAVQPRACSLGPNPAVAWGAPKMGLPHPQQLQLQQQ